MSDRGITSVVRPGPIDVPPRDKHDPPERSEADNVRAAIDAMPFWGPVAPGDRGRRKPRSWLRELETYLRALPLTPAPSYGSDEWYVLRILEAIERGRHARSGESKALIYEEGIRLGELLGEARAKGWQVTADGLKAAEDNRKFWSAGVKARESKRAPLIDDVRVYVERNPTHSCRTIAHNLFDKHGRSGDRLKALEALRKKIERILQKK